jgi:GT2 family glycosyltransferase
VTIASTIPPDATSPRVAILILSYNAEAWLARCLDSVAKTRFPAVQVYLLDNGSTDKGPLLVREQFPWVRVIEHGANLGFCEGNNRGIELALVEGATHVVLLNPDTWVEPDWLSLLVEVMERHGLGMAGAVQLAYDTSEFNSWTRMAVPDLLEELAYPEEARDWIAVEWVEGSCLLVSREVLDKVGWLDPIYFAFYEEIDWCRRARAHGYSIGLVPASRIHHFRGGSWEATSTLSRERRYRCDRSQFLYQLTDLERGMGANLAGWGRTLLTKGKEVLVAGSLRRGWDLFRIQIDLLRHRQEIWQKWKGDRARLTVCQGKMSTDRRGEKGARKGGASEE